MPRITTPTTRYKPNIASVYYHPAEGQSVRIGLLSTIGKNLYAYRAINGKMSAELLGVPEAKLFSGPHAVNVKLSDIPRPLLQRDAEVAGYLKTILEETYQGRLAKATALNSSALAHQLLGRCKPGTFTLAPVMPALTHKAVVRFDFLIANRYSIIGGFHRLLDATKKGIESEQKLFIRRNITGTPEALMVTDVGNRHIGFLPPFMESFILQNSLDGNYPRLVVKNFIVRDDMECFILEVGVESLVYQDTFVKPTKERGHRGDKAVLVTIPSAKPMPDRNNKVIVTKKRGRPPKKLIPSSEWLVPDVPPVVPVAEVIDPTTPIVVPVEVTKKRPVPVENKNVNTKLRKQIQFTAVACMNENRVIGQNGKLPWYIPEDLKLFKQLTKNEILVVGRKTYESLPSQMKHRHFVVVSGRGEKELQLKGESLTVVNDVASAVTAAQDLAILLGRKSVYVIGGANIYEQMLSKCKELIITCCRNPAVDADAYFPEIPDGYFPEMAPIELCRNEYGPVTVQRYRNLQFTR